MKKGFTLVELIISMALASIILALCTNVLISFTKSYKEEVAKNKEGFYLKEALMYIENEIQNDTKSVEIINNKLIVYKTDEVHKNEIFFNTQNNLVVAHFEYGHNLSINNIVTKIKGIDLKKVNGVIYISLESMNGDKLERCIGINILN